MARTYKMFDVASGKEVGEQSVEGDFAPVVPAGQRTELAKPLRSPSEKPDAPEKPAKGE